MLSVVGVLALPSLAAAQDHGEVGAFVDYYRLDRVDPKINFIGVGGRVAVRAAGSHRGADPPDHPPRSGSANAREAFARPHPNKHPPALESSSAPRCSARLETRRSL